MPIYEIIIVSTFISLILAILKSLIEYYDEPLLLYIFTFIILFQIMFIAIAINNSFVVFLIQTILNIVTWKLTNYLVQLILKYMSLRKHFLKQDIIPKDELIVILSLMKANSLFLKSYDECTVNKLLKLLKSNNLYYVKHTELLYLLDLIDGTKIYNKLLYEFKNCLKTADCDDAIYFKFKKSFNKFKKLSNECLIGFDATLLYSWLVLAVSELKTYKNLSKTHLNSLEIINDKLNHLKSEQNDLQKDFITEEIMNFNNLVDKVKQIN